MSETVTYTWDASAGCSHGIGRLCAVTDGAGSTTYSYNDKGYLVSATRVEAGQAHVTQYVRDLSGQLLSWVDPTGSQFDTARNVLGQPQSASVTRAGMQRWVSRSITHDAAGELSAASYGMNNTAALSRRFNADGQLVEGLLVQRSPGLSVTWSSPYAPAGERLGITVTVSPAEARGTLKLCRDSAAITCTGAALLGTLEVPAGGTYTLYSDALGAGIYQAGVRFEPVAPFVARFTTPARPIFIGVPPQQLIDDLLP